MSEIVLSGMAKLIDATLNVNQVLMQVPYLARTRTTNLLAAQVQSIPTTAGGTALTVTGVTAPGLAVFQNLDNANYVEIGFDVAATFRPAMRLGPGDFQIVWLDPTQTWKALANTSAVQLSFTILQRNP